MNYFDISKNEQSQLINIPGHSGFISVSPMNQDTQKISA